MKKNVRVSVSYFKFEFGEDVQKAVDFADVAAETAREDKEIYITINYIPEEDDEEEGES